MQKPSINFSVFFFIITIVLIVTLPIIVHSQNITYYLEIDEQDWNSFHVRISVEKVNQPQLVFEMPVWRPGAYIRRDFGQHVKNFKAFGESIQPLQTIRMNQGTWCVDVSKSATVEVEYDVEYTSPRFMGIRMDSTFAIVDGAMNFMYIKNKEHLPLKVEFRVPHNWKLATALPTDQRAFEYRAQNYDHLIDCPVLMSQFKNYYFTIHNNPIYVIINGRQNFDINKFLIMIKRIVSYQTDLFNEIPFEKYFFLFHIAKDAVTGGGLEHRNSTYIKLSERFLRENINEAANIVAH